MKASRPEGRFWDSAEQAQWFAAIAHDNPKLPGEGPLAYTDRLATIAGKVKAGMLEPKRNLREIRLPYKDSE